MPKRTQRSTTKKIRKTKRVLNWGAIFWMLLFVNLGVAVFFSQATSVQYVRVTGCNLSDQLRVRKIIQPVKGVPYIQVKTIGIESEILENPEIRSARLLTNILGRAVLKIELHTPIAKIKDSKNLFLSEDGTVFRSDRSLVSRLQIVLPKNSNIMNASFVGGWEARMVAQFCKKLPKIISKKMWDVKINTRGVISLIDKNNSKIIFGSAENLEDKFDQLEKILSKRPKCLESFKELNLTVPKHPVYIPINSR